MKFKSTLTFQPKKHLNNACRISPFNWERDSCWWYWRSLYMYTLIGVVFLYCRETWISWVSAWLTDATLNLCAKTKCCPLADSMKFEDTVTFYLTSPLSVSLPFGRRVILQIIMHTAGSGCGGSAEINGISAQGHSGGAPHGACLIAAERPL